MKDVPIPYIRANQTGIIAFFILAFFEQLPLFIAILWLIEGVGLLFGMKANLFILFAKPFFSQWIDRVPTQAYELTRFDNQLTVVLLTLSFVLFELRWASAGYIVAGVVAGLALLAMFGLSLGSFFYKQVKKF
ncbi:DUF4395 domain-containing protein [Desulfitobacterium metallireducens]|uniref:DUF4395 domain-containing protein n=1 Tax=Desulfitobacterium metallireducens DSM 15288 TaxID=871968 RepID=W0EAX3_9FIRM|nr:DUF4395 domain-containing protein [Desulfitobacterium metallireducens]AHF08025.1 hypothetical protein DESME_14030 [Desulfitobacterium metallireducens DSM 15288]